MLCTAGQNIFMLFMATVDSLRLRMTLCNMKHLVKNMAISIDLATKQHSCSCLPVMMTVSVHNDMSLLVWLLLRKLVATCR